MALDPLIARPYIPDVSNTLGEIARLRVADNYRNALLQQDQQEFAYRQQKDQAAAQAVADDDAEWDAAYEKRDWGTMARLDPQATKLIYEHENPQAAGGADPFTLSPGSRRYKTNPDGTVTEVASVPFAPPAVVVRDVAGIPTVIDPGNRMGQGQQQPLTDLPTVANNAATVKGAEAGASTTAQGRAEAALNEPKRAEKVRQITSAIDNTFTEIDRALKGVNWGTVGPIGSLTKSVPGTPAYDLAQTLLTVKANIGFDRLQAMRDASPTGGALGQVAVQELSALQASIASLDQAQSVGQLRANLAKVRQHYNGWKKAVSAAAPNAPNAPGAPIDFNSLPE